MLFQLALHCNATKKKKKISFPPTLSSYLMASSMFKMCMHVEYTYKFWKSFLLFQPCFYFKMTPLLASKLTKLINFLFGLLQENVLIFLHGFLGTGEDWLPVMMALSGLTRCVSIDLPGHGGSKLHHLDNKVATEETVLSIDRVADVLHKLIEQLTPKKVILVGYSMGARIALYMALRFSQKVQS